MSLTAEQLSKSGARGAEIDQIINQQLQCIDIALQKAPRVWGRNTVQYSIPESFGYLTLGKKEAQCIIYSTVLKNLEERGFETKIILEEKKTTIVISWMTDLAIEELMAMRAFIAPRVLNARDLPRFIAEGALPAPGAATTVRTGRAAPPPPMVANMKGRVMQPRGGVVVKAPKAPAGEAPEGGSGGGSGGVSSAEAAILQSLS